MISSVNNSTITRTRRLRKRAERLRRGAFIAEGHRAVRVALDAGCRLEIVLHTPAGGERHRRLLLDAADAGSRAVEASPGVMRALSSAANTPDVLAVAPIPASVETGSGPVLVLSVVRDPATVGTLLASAAAAGVRRAVAVRGTADLYGSTPVRVGAGAHFVLGLSEAGSLEEFLTAWRGRPVVSLVDEGPAPWTADLRGSFALVVGDEQPSSPDARISVPAGDAGAKAPLAVRAALTMFEARRQREAQ